MTEAFGITFQNPVGIAAGFDKNANFINELDIMGFGFIEVGTVTPLPQKGNSKPRLFRLIQDKALINRMGFNNAGVEAMVPRLKKVINKGIVIGGNIGKNKTTSLENAHLDYLTCFEKLYEYVDYFVVNVSSPNTPGLRSLQDKKPLLKILSTLIISRKNRKISKPILLKISPDLSHGQLTDIIDIVNQIKIDGIIATNTTTDRQNLNVTDSALDQIGNGGLSGAPLLSKSNQIISTLRQTINDSISIIGVGGINDTTSALSKLKCGAELIQIYTGFVYKGPFLVKRIKKYLVQNLKF